MNKPAKPSYHSLIRQIGETLAEGRRQVAYAVNYHMVLAYWEIGRYIVEFEQKGESRADYGKELLEKLSKDLSERYGKGMSRSNLIYMRQCFIEYEKIQTVSGIFILCQRDQKCETVSHILTWSHYFELLKIQDKNERAFYEKECISEKWSVRVLKRPIRSGLYYRLALSRDKQAIIDLSQKGIEHTKPEDIIKSPLELGTGFAFIGPQHRISLANKHFYVDLVFYHRILKCFVLFNLKRGEAAHQDIGQMNMYLNYFEKEQNVKGDSKPVGVVLAATKDDILVEYATGNLSSQIFISTYQFYLPEKDELKRELVKILDH